MVDREKFWKCPNCGQIHFSDHPPDMCAVCQDFTTWQLLSGRPDGSSLDESDDNSPDSQRPLFND